MKCIFNNTNICLWLEGRVTVAVRPERMNLGGNIGRQMEVGSHAQCAPCQRVSKLDNYEIINVCLSLY